MKIYKTTKLDINEKLQRWNETSEEEKEEIMNLARPSLKKWLDLPFNKRKTVTYSCLLGVLFIAAFLVFSESLAIRVIALFVFIADWMAFLFTEKCIKQGVDLLQGLLIYGHFTEEDSKLSDSSASNTTAK